MPDLLSSEHGGVRQRAKQSVETIALSSQHRISGTVTASSECESNQSKNKDDQVRQQRKQGFRSNETWASFLRGWQVFRQYIHPHTTIRIQLQILIVCMGIIAQRALAVLYPRQLGVVLDKLSEERSASASWTDVLVWMLYGTMNMWALPVIIAVLEDRVSTWCEGRIRQEVFQRIMRASMHFHDGQQSSQLISAVETAGALTSLIRSVFVDIGPVIVDVVVAVWYIDYVMDVYAVSAMALVGVTYFFVSSRMSPILSKARDVCITKDQICAQHILETITNWRTVAYWNRQGHEETRLRELTEDFHRANRWQTESHQLLFGAQELCNLAGRFVVVSIAIRLASKKHVSVGGFAGTVAYWDAITRPIWILEHSFRHMTDKISESKRLLQLLTTDDTIQESINARPLDVRGASIIFSNVCFTYPEFDVAVRNINISIEYGRRLAIVGESGSGKSTLLKLLLRFYDVDRGCIKIGGHDVRDITLESLRENVGFLAQDAVILDRSVFDNVRYGRLDASDTEVHQACKDALIHDKVTSLPHGYHTPVGERGAKLSGGEAQRLAIARLLLRNPAVVALDEATSALDIETETKIFEVLHQRLDGRTIIMITHRLSTIQHAELILVMKHGRIVEQGSHHDLLASKQDYFDLWTKQFPA